MAPTVPDEPMQLGGMLVQVVQHVLDAAQGEDLVEGGADEAEGVDPGLPEGRRRPAGGGEPSREAGIATCFRANPVPPV